MRWRQVTWPEWIDLSRMEQYLTFTARICFSDGSHQGVAAYVNAEAAGGAMGEHL